MIGALLTALRWTLGNPFKAALILCAITTVTFYARSVHYKGEAETARIDAGDAKEVLSRTRGREKAIIALETKQRQENETLDSLIRNRRYFDSH